MKVNPETNYIVEVRKVVRDGDGNPLPAGDWPSVMVEYQIQPIITSEYSLLKVFDDDAGSSYTWIQGESECDESS